MADATSKRLIQLAGSAESSALRCAALAVLAELEIRGPAVDAMLCQAVDNPDPGVRAQALSAIGCLRVEKSLPQLLARVREGGVESEAAAQAAAKLGAKGARALHELMPEVAPGLRRRIAGALPAGDSASAGTLTLEVLLDADANVVDAAARALIARVHTLESAPRKRLAQQVLDILEPRKPSPLPAHCEAAFLRLLAALDDSRAEAAFWRRIDARYPPELRAVALQALGTRSTPSSRERVHALLECARDADFRVAAPSLMILREVTANNRQLVDWMGLFEAPDPGARHFAVEKLGDKDRADVAGALLNQLDHPDRSLKERALRALAELRHGREALVHALLEAESPDRAWALARIQAPFAREHLPALRAQIFAQACKHLEADDRRAEALLFLLREADPRALRDRLEDRGVRSRKKKEYAKALAYFRLLARDPACGEPVRFELAGCGLKLSAKDLAAEARTADPCLQQFGGMIHRNAIDVFGAVEKASWLEAADLFYLGFHFVEGRGPEKDFGANVLRLLVRRFARAKIAKDAKNKLKSQGLNKQGGSAD